jgi:hypothetical protein
VNLAASRFVIFAPLPAKLVTLIHAGISYQDLESLLREQKVQESSKIKFKEARIDALERLLTQRTEETAVHLRYSEGDYRKQVLRNGELEALVREMEVQSAAEVNKLRDEIMELTGLLNKNMELTGLQQRQMQSQVNVSQVKVQTSPAHTLHTRVIAVPSYLESHLLENAIADACSGFRLIEGRQVSTFAEPNSQSTRRSNARSSAIF